MNYKNQILNQIYDMIQQQCRIVKFYKKISVLEIGLQNLYLSKILLKKCNDNTIQTLIKSEQKISLDMVQTVQKIQVNKEKSKLMEQKLIYYQSYLFKFEEFIYSQDNIDDINDFYKIDKTNSQQKKQKCQKIKKDNKFFIDIKMLNRSLKIQSTQNNFIKDQIDNIDNDQNQIKIPVQKLIQLVKQENVYELNKLFSFYNVQHLDTLDDQGNSMLQLAAMSDNNQLIDILFDKCDINNKNNMQLTALDYAIQNGNKDLTKKIQDYNQVKKLSQFRGKTVLTQLY